MGSKFRWQRDAAMSNRNDFCRAIVSNPRLSGTDDTCPVARNRIRCRREVSQHSWVTRGRTSCWHGYCDLNKRINGIKNSAFAGVLDDYREV